MAKDIIDKGKGKLQMPGSVRSRKGCLVCRRRHKKCDEVFGEDGSCERCRAAGLECLLPPTSNRTRYSGATYTPTARARKPSAAPAPIEAATTSLLETELPSPDGPVAGPSTLPPLAGPSTLPPLAVDDPSLITTMTGPTTSDLEHLLPLLSPAASSSALALLGPQPDCPPSSSWDPFEACFDLSGPSNYQQAPLSPNSLFQQWPGRMSGFESGSPLEFLGSLDLYGAVGSLSPMRFTSESLSRATSALTVKYVSPDTRLIQDCYTIIHSTWLNNTKAADGYAQRSLKTGMSKLARDLVVKVFEHLVPSIATNSTGDLLDASHLHDQAVRRLLGCDNMPLEDRLHIISDLQLYNFAASGAKQAYEAVALADKYFSALGNQAQLAAFLRASLTDPRKTSVRVFVGMDLSRAIAIPTSRPLLPRLELFPTRAENDMAHVVAFPYEIAVVLSHICHTPAELSAAARTAETATTDIDLMLIDESMSNRPTAVRIWKLAARALLYQRVRRVGALHPVLRAVSTDLQREFSAYGGPPASAFEKALALPLFLAGTLAISQADRDAVEAHWATLRPERGWREPIALLRRLWAEVDETGDTVRWDDVVTSEGWSVAFF